MPHILRETLLSITSEKRPFTSRGCRVMCSAHCGQSDTSMTLIYTLTAYCTNDVGLWLAINHGDGATACAYSAYEGFRNFSVLLLYSSGHCFLLTGASRKSCRHWPNPIFYLSYR